MLWHSHGSPIATPSRQQSTIRGYLSACLCNRMRGQSNGKCCLQPLTVLAEFGAAIAQVVPLVRLYAAEHPGMKMKLVCRCASDASECLCPFA